MDQLRKRGWIRFSIAHCLVLTAGIAVGLVPYVVREISEPPPPQILICLKVFEIENGSLTNLVIDELELGDGLIIDDAWKNRFDNEMEALLSDNKAKLVVQPTLVSSDNGLTEFLSGGEVPVSLNNGTSFEFKPFGIEIETTSRILRNGNIAVDIEHRSKALKPGSNNGIGPEFTTESVETKIEIRDRGRFLMIGPRLQATNSNQNSKTTTLIVAQVMKLMIR